MAQELRHLISDAPRVMVVDGSKLVRKLIADVLAEQRRRVAVFDRAGGQAQRAGHLGRGAAQAVGQIEAQAAGLDLRVGEHLGQVVDRPAGHAGRLQQRHPFGGALEHRGLAQQGNQLGAVIDPRLVAGKARVVGQSR